MAKGRVEQIASDLAVLKKKYRKDFTGRTSPAFLDSCNRHNSGWRVFVP